MHQHRRTSCFAHFFQSANVIDVRVRNQYGAHFQSVARDYFQNCFHVVAGIDDDGFARNRIADYVAVALQHSQPEEFRELNLARRRFQANSVLRFKLATRHSVHPRSAV